LRDDIQPGSPIPDYELADDTGRKRRLSELQRDNPMILHLSRGLLTQRTSAGARFKFSSVYPEVKVGYGGW